MRTAQIGESEVKEMIPQFRLCILPVDGPNGLFISVLTSEGPQTSSGIKRFDALDVLTLML